MARAKQFHAIDCREALESGLGLVLAAQLISRSLTIFSKCAILPNSVIAKEIEIFPAKMCWRKIGKMLKGKNGKKSLFGNKNCLEGTGKLGQVLKGKAKGLLATKNLQVNLNLLLPIKSIVMYHDIFYYGPFLISTFLTSQRCVQAAGLVQGSKVLRAGSEQVGN